MKSQSPPLNSLIAVFVGLLLLLVAGGVLWLSNAHVMPPTQKTKARADIRAFLPVKERTLKAVMTPPVSLADTTVACRMTRRFADRPSSSPCNRAKFGSAHHREK